MLVINILLAFVWLACWGDTSPEQFFIGFILSFFMIRFSENSGLMSHSSYTSKVLGIMNLLVFFTIELWKSNIRVARDILRRKPLIVPAIIGVPLSLQTDWAITLLANLITLTPGTLSLDLSKDKKILYIHTMYFDDEDKVKFIESIKDGFEKRIMILEKT